LPWDEDGGLNKFDLLEEGLCGEYSAIAIKRVLARQLAEEMNRKKMIEMEYGYKDADESYATRSFVVFGKEKGFAGNDAMSSFCCGSSVI
jgi:hypothetical protein